MRPKSDSITPHLLLTAAALISLSIFLNLNLRGDDAESTNPHPTATPMTGPAPWKESGITFSTPLMTRSPKSNVTFYGPFLNETLYAAAPTPGNHEFLEVNFDLLILRSWDGSVNAEVGGEMPTMDKMLGPDFFRLALRDGPTLLYTTFSNVRDPNFHANAQFQNYPSQVPGDHLNAMTATAARNTLGYNYPWPDADRLYPMDATYHIHFIIPHHDGSATLELSGMNLLNIADESWGITNLQLRAVPVGDPGPAHPTANEIGAAFTDCLNPSLDSRDAYQILIFGGDDTVRWIRNHVDHSPLAEAEVQEQINFMLAGDQQTEQREAATGKLAALGHSSEPALRDARKTANAEARARIDWALMMLGVKKIEDDSTRRAILATRVLEIIGTPEALVVRKSLVTK